MIWKQVTVIVTLIVLLVVVALAVDDSAVYNEMVTIKGNVKIVDHPELGRTVGSGEFIVFQRADCKRCLIGVHADKEGNFSLRVGKGRYKVIVYNPSPPTYDRLAPDQERYVTATSTLVDTVFDIRLATPRK